MAEKEEDPFASILKFSKTSDSQEAKYPDLLSAWDRQFSSSPDRSSCSDDRSVFLTPPEHHCNSHISSSEDRKPNGGDGSDKARVSEARFGGDTAPLGETEVVGIEGDEGGVAAGTTDIEVIKIEGDEGGVGEERAGTTDIEVIEIDGDGGGVGEETVRAARMTDKEVVEIEGDEGGVGVGATDGGCEGRRGRKRRQLPPSLEANEKVDGVKGKEKVDGGCEWRKPPLPTSSLKVKKRSWLLDNLGLLKTTLADTSDCDEDVDFLETAKRNGMIFPRPRWWPPAADDSFY